MAKKAAKPKATSVNSAENVKAVVPTKIEMLSIDFGREDINTMGRKINEIITIINGER